MTFAVESGEEFVPRLFAELGVPIKSVSVARPSLDDVFMSYTGTTIRDAEAELGMAGDAGHGAALRQEAVRDGDPHHHRTDEEQEDGAHHGWTTNRNVFQFQRITRY